MPQSVSADRPVHALFGRRTAPVGDLAADADTMAKACLDMAQRFRRGGKLIVFGNGAAATDAQHVAVEFVHPAIVGKPALPAISLTADVATLTGLANRDSFAQVFAHQLRQLAEPADIVLGISTDGECPNVLRGLIAGYDLGLLTMAMVGGAGGLIGAERRLDHLLLARTSDPRIVKEIQVTTYHLLWELVHVFLAQPGELAAEAVK